MRKSSEKNDGAENTAFQIKTSLDTLIGILDNVKEKYQLTWKYSNRKCKKWYSNKLFSKLNILGIFCDLWKNRS